jgi:hypothetical protein
VTVSGTTFADVNKKIFEQFALGRDKLLNSECVETIPIKNRIVSLMSVPLVQGGLRYAYKVVNEGGTSKQKAEGQAFAAAILGRIAECNPTVAQTIRNNQFYSATTPMGDGFAAVKAAYESVYSCLGITCADVGALLDSTAAAGTPYAGAEACTDSAGNEASAAVPRNSAYGLGLAGLFLLPWMQ